MAALTQSDIEARLLALLPSGWFGDNSSTVAPVLNAVIAGAATALFSAYSLLQYAKAQTRFATMSGGFIDLASFDYLGRTTPRRPGETDDAFAPRIKREIFRERVTRQGMVQMLTDLTGREPAIFEAWNPADTGGYGYAMGYGVAGAYGSAAYPAQAWVTAWRPGGGGEPYIAGYGDAGAGYGVGYAEYGTAETSTGGVADADIINAVATTKAVGVQIVLSITC